MHITSERLKVFRYMTAFLKSTGNLRTFEPNLGFVASIFVKIWPFEIYQFFYFLNKKKKKKIQCSIQMHITSERLKVFRYMTAFLKSTGNLRTFEPNLGFVASIFLKIWPFEIYQFFYFLNKKLKKKIQCSIQMHITSERLKVFRYMMAFLKSTGNLRTFEPNLGFVASIFVKIWPFEIYQFFYFLNKKLKKKYSAPFKCT